MPGICDAGRWRRKPVIILALEMGLISLVALACGGQGTTAVATATPQPGTPAITLSRTPQPFVIVFKDPTVIQCPGAAQTNLAATHEEQWNASQPDSQSIDFIGPTGLTLIGPITTSGAFHLTGSGPEGPGTATLTWDGNLSSTGGIVSGSGTSQLVFTLGQQTCSVHFNITIAQVNAGAGAGGAAAGHCTGSAQLIVDQFFPDRAQSPGATPPTFSTGGKRYCLLELATYHWANGQGAPAGGQLTLLDDHQRVVGQWKAVATPATAGVLANWESHIPITPPVIIDGTYTVQDSGADSWSWSEASGGKGFLRVWGEAAGP